ncbi:MAG: hypothetical protein PHY92_09075, partial [Alphaproteobacteria bacterium]|nr:hypothetical protein [Alphaproteobacteria bacterium]
VAEVADRQWNEFYLATLEVVTRHGGLLYVGTDPRKNPSRIDYEFSTRENRDLFVNAMSQMVESGQYVGEILVVVGNRECTLARQITENFAPRVG